MDKPILILIYENKYDKKNVLKKMVNKLWLELMNENPYLQKTFPEKPMIAYKNGKNIKKTLISSKFPAPWHDGPKKTRKKDALDNENMYNLVALLLENL